jgi:hypothetical protein
MILTIIIRIHPRDDETSFKSLKKTLRATESDYVWSMVFSLSQPNSSLLPSHNCNDHYYVLCGIGTKTPLYMPLSLLVTVPICMLMFVMYIPSGKFKL